MGSQIFTNELVKLYKTIWETKAIPKEWGHSKLVCLWKGPQKGSSKDPATYRGLQIGSALCKIMIVTIIERLKKWYDLQLLDQQQGFHQSRGTTDGIFIIKSIQQITNKIKKKLIYSLLTYLQHLTMLKESGYLTQLKNDIKTIN